MNNKNIVLNITLQYESYKNNLLKKEKNKIRLHFVY